MEAKKKWYLSKGVMSIVFTIAILIIAFLADDAVNLFVPELSLAIIKLLGGIAAALGISSAADKNRRPLG